VTAPDPRSVTLLRAQGGRRLAKTLRADCDTQPYDDARLFDVSEVQAADIEALAKLLAALAAKPNVCIIRGAPLPGFVGPRRRLLHADAEAGDAPTMNDAAKAWVLLDVDGLRLPPSHKPTDIFSCGIAAVLALPADFRGAAAVAVPTASHGIKPGIRLRLGFMLDRPATCAELRRWLGAAPVDRAALGAVQCLYTAEPQALHPSWHRCGACARDPRACAAPRSPARHLLRWHGAIRPRRPRGCGGVHCRRA
jgi:hypothetical protein